MVGHGLEWGEGMGCLVSASAPLLGLPHAPHLLHSHSLCCFWVSSSVRGEVEGKKRLWSLTWLTESGHIKLSVLEAAKCWMSFRLDWGSSKLLHCIIPDVGLASSIFSPSFAAPTDRPQSLPPLVFSSPPTTYFQEEIHPDASSQVTFFSVHLTCDR